MTFMAVLFVRNEGLVKSTGQIKLLETKYQSIEGADRSNP
jgi:hypothetical protein